MEIDTAENRQIDRFNVFLFSAGLGGHEPHAGVVVGCALIAYLNGARGHFVSMHLSGRMQRI